jgi:hypothetical protein
MIAATRAANRGATVAAADLRTEACDESSAMKVATVSGCRPDATRCHARPGLAATDDEAISGESSRARNRLICRLYSRLS